MVAVSKTDDAAAGQWQVMLFFPVVDRADKDVTFMVIIVFFRTSVVAIPGSREGGYLQAAGCPHFQSVIPIRPGLLVFGNPPINSLQYHPILAKFQTLFFWSDISYERESHHQRTLLPNSEATAQSHNWRTTAGQEQTVHY